MKRFNKSQKLFRKVNKNIPLASQTFSKSYLQYIKGLRPQNAGLVLLAQPGIQAVLSMHTGRLSDRIEPMRVVSLGMAIQAIGLTLFVFVTESTSLAFIIISLIILGLGNSLFSTPTTNAIMSSVDRRYYGVASGMRSTMLILAVLPIVMYGSRTCVTALSDPSACASPTASS